MEKKKTLILNPNSESYSKFASSCPSQILKFSSHLLHYHCGNQEQPPAARSPVTGTWRIPKFRTSIWVPVKKNRELIKKISRGGQREGKMEKRNSTIGRPSGTDGSDYSYRMVVDSRYQKVAKGKKRLSVLLTLQAVLLVIAVVFAILPGMEKDTDTPNKFALGSVVCGLIILIITEYGRRRSRAIFLGIYPVTESLTIFLVGTLGRRHSIVKVIQEARFWETKKFDDFPVLQACWIVYAGAVVVVKILTTKTIVSVIHNMSPPKKAKNS